MKKFTLEKTTRKLDLPLNKMLKFRLMTVIIRCKFQEDSKLYPQLFQDDCLYAL